METTMKKIFSAMVALSLFSGIAYSGPAEDAAWINKCAGEVDPEGNPPNVVKSWCTCMNGEMSENETLSILAWEKTPAGQTADKKCSASSGWKSK